MTHLTSETQMLRTRPIRPPNPRASALRLHPCHVPHRHQKGDTGIFLLLWKTTVSLRSGEPPPQEAGVPRPHLLLDFVNRPKRFSAQFQENGGFQVGGSTYDLVPHAGKRGLMSTTMRCFLGQVGKDNRDHLHSLTCPPWDKTAEPINPDVLT